MRHILVSPKSVAAAAHAGLVILNLLPVISCLPHGQATMEKIGSSNKMSSRLSFEIKFHGFLWWASVGFLMPVGILMKRMSNKEESGRTLRIIFYIHIFTEVLAVLVGTAAAAMSIKYFNNAFDNYHQRIGLAFYVVMWLQVLTAIFRPKRGSKGRSIWFLFHWLLGTAVPLLGVINVYTGLQAYHGRTLNDVSIWTFIFTVQISLLLFLYLLQDKWHYIRKQGTKPVQPTDQEMPTPCQQKEVSSEPC